LSPSSAVGGGGEAVFGEAAVAGEAHIALAAVAREAVALVEAELSLLLGSDQVDQAALGDVSE
jgi:hypothetical protein